MDDLSFLKNFPTGDAILNVRYHDGSVAHITGLDIQTIGTASPLLSYSFEDTASGPRFCIECATPTSLACLLRYIYSEPRDYVPDSCKDSPMSLLSHVQVYKLGETYDIPDLQSLSKGNITRACEFSCSTPTAPLDLCEAIDFVYQDLASDDAIIDILTNYCVSMFLYHSLGENVAFRKLAYEHRCLQQDLCMVNIKRGFVDEAALAIIQLPIRPFEEPHKNALEAPLLKDVLYDMWVVLDDIETEPKPQIATRRPNKEKHVFNMTTEQQPRPQVTLPFQTRDRQVLCDTQCEPRAPRPASTGRNVLFGAAPDLAQQVSERLLDAADDRPRVMKRYPCAMRDQRPPEYKFTPSIERFAPPQKVAAPAMLRVRPDGLVDESLTDASDEDDGFVHVRPRSEDDWAMVEV